MLLARLNVTFLRVYIFKKKHFLLNMCSLLILTAMYFFYICSNLCAFFQLQGWDYIQLNLFGGSKNDFRLWKISIRIWHRFKPVENVLPKRFNNVTLGKYMFFFIYAKSTSAVLFYAPLIQLYICWNNSMDKLELNISKFCRRRGSLHFVETVVQIICVYVINF